MRKITRNKKGDSTIIAVVLLTVIVVGLGALLFTFFRGQITGMQEKTSQKIEQTMCGAEVTLNVLEQEGGNKACAESLSSTNYTIIVEGGPSTDLTGIIIAGTGTTATTAVNDTAIPRATAKKFTVDLRMNTTDIAEIKINPVTITEKGEKMVCTDGGVTISKAYIGVC